MGTCGARAETAMIAPIATAPSDLANCRIPRFICGSFQVKQGRETTLGQCP